MINPNFLSASDYKTSVSYPKIVISKLNKTIFDNTFFIDHMNAKHCERRCLRSLKTKNDLSNGGSLRSG